MYKVIKIGEGDLDRFISIEDEKGNHIEVFDYSASTVPSIEDAFILREGNRYNMKLELYGDILEDEKEHKYGKVLEFSIVGTEQVGKYVFYRVETDLGMMYLPKNSKSDYVNDATKCGIINYTRIGLIQVNEMVHPEY